MALMCINLAPTSLAAVATFSAPLHCMSSNAFCDPCMTPTRDIMTLASLKAGTSDAGFVISKVQGGRSFSSGIVFRNNLSTISGWREDSWTRRFSRPRELPAISRAIFDPTRKSICQRTSYRWNTSIPRNPAPQTTIFLVAIADLFHVLYRTSFISIIKRTYLSARHSDLRVDQSTKSSKTEMTFSAYL
jgi:hypothetical protein